MHLEPSNKEAYASEIIIDASPDWQQLPVLGLRLTGKEIAADNAYLIKILALTAGYRFIEHEVSREGFRNDYDLARQVISYGYARLRQGDCAQPRAI